MTIHGATLGVVVLTVATAASAGWLLLTHAPDRPETAAPSSAPPVTSAARRPGQTALDPSPVEPPAERAPPSATNSPAEADHRSGSDGGRRVAVADQGAAHPADEQSGAGPPSAERPAAPRPGVGGPLAAAGSPRAPVLDLVRIEPDGAGLIAGRASAGEAVELIVERDVVGRATAGSDGAFVAFIEVDPSKGAQEIAARAAPPADQGATPGAGAAPGASAGAYVVVAAAPGDAPVIVRPEESGLSVIQPPARSPATGVTLDVISYDETGGLVLSGRSGKGVEIRAFLGDDRLARVDIAEGGGWRLRPDRAVAPGVYRLRLEEIGAEGRVLTRLSTPFKREAGSPGALGPGEFTVQRGDNLWRIAERRYGAGARYTIIYGANQGAIDDPDLIYPGQVFDIPAAP